MMVQTTCLLQLHAFNLYDIHKVERRHLEAAVDESIKTLAIAGSADDATPSTSDDLQVNNTNILLKRIEAQRWRYSAHLFALLLVRVFLISNVVVEMQFG